MQSANTIPTAIIRFAANLPIINFDFSRFFGRVQHRDVALYNAYAKFEKSYGNRADPISNEEFLTNDGASIISAFANGRVTRHEASVSLAHAWNDQMSPALSTIRKRRIVDATMAADSLLTYYEAELTSEG